MHCPTYDSCTTYVPPGLQATVQQRLRLKPGECGDLVSGGCALRRGSATPRASSARNPLVQRAMALPSLRGLASRSSTTADTPSCVGTRTEQGVAKSRVLAGRGLVRDVGAECGLTAHRGSSRCRGNLWQGAPCG